MLGVLGLLIQVGVSNGFFNGYTLSKQAVCVPTTPTEMRLAERFASGSSYTLDFPEHFTALQESFENTGFLDYINYPLKRLVKTKEQDAKPKKADKSSSFFHTVWITDEYKPKTAPLKNLMKNMTFLPDYKIIIWTNIDLIIFLHQNPDARKPNIQVRNIKDLNTPFKGVESALQSPEKTFLATNKKHTMGFRVDVAKYLILYQYGGILADLNFKLTDTFSAKSLEDYDFIGTKRGLYRMENYFFKSKSQHPIIEKTLMFIEDLLTTSNPIIKFLREEIKHVEHNSLTEKFTMFPLKVGRIMGANVNGNTDVLSVDNFEFLGNNCLPNSDVAISKAELEKISEHERLFIQRKKSDSKEFTIDFVISFQLVEEILESHTNTRHCIDEKKQIGSDGKEASWWAK